MTEVAVSSAKKDNPDESKSRRVALWLATIVAGLAGAAMMYLEWRGFFGVPHELSVPVHMADEGSPVKMWAPWWVPASTMMLLTMMLWRLLAVRKGGISFWGGVLAMVIAGPLIYLVAIICLEVGAMLQFNPRPPINRILALVPLVIREGLELIVVMGSVWGILWGSLIGVVTVLLGRLMLRLARRVDRAMAEATI
jgi:hypothetical protein